MAVNDPAGQLYERMLILRCQAGDEAALAELIATYSPRLRLFLRKLVHQDSAADDLLQDTWFDVYRKINALENPQAFAAWLYRIARDIAYRALRRRPEPISPADEKWTDSIAAEEPQFAHDDIERVRAALDQLPLQQREVLMLRFVEDMSYEQIAEVIARPVGTVRSRIHYAKLELRTNLESTNIRKERPS